MWYSGSIVNFLQNAENRCPIAQMWGQVMGCILGIKIWSMLYFLWFHVIMRSHSIGISQCSTIPHIPLTHKHLGHIFQKVIFISSVVCCKFNILLWIWPSQIIWTALGIMMVWSFSTGASVATVLITHPGISSNLLIKWDQLYFSYANIFFACFPIYSSHNNQT